VLGLRRLWQEPEQLLGDLVGGVTKQPVASAGDQHEVGARDTPSGGTNVVRWYQPVVFARQQQARAGDAPSWSPK
jgi:hypothetical protein